MRILWITQAKVSISAKHVSSGGWTVGALKGLVSCDDIEMHYAFLCDNNESYCEDNVRFWGISQLNGYKYPKDTQKDIESLINKIKPDVIHCWGTETPVTIAAVRAAENTGFIDKVVINIQGMLVLWENVFARTGVPGLKLPGIRPIELYAGNCTYSFLQSFRKRIPFELEAISKVKHLVGRTPVDKTFARQFAPQASYHFCNETLREPFYGGEKWSASNMQRHSIFMSETQYPVKSLEKMFEALAILAKKYDDVELFVAGQDMFCERKLGKQPWDLLPSWLKRDGYQSYLYKLAIELGIKNRVNFIGKQDADGMKEHYLSANAYVSASIIENESNSLSEAMILGIPCVASYVGGVICRINDGEDGFFYPWNEPWQLADRLMQIFDDDELAMNFSDRSSKKMSCIVDRQTNLDRMLEIYKEIAE